MCSTVCALRVHVQKADVVLALLLDVVGCRHSSTSRRLFRQAVDVAARHMKGLAQAGGVKTLLVWAHQEKKGGRLSRVG